MPASRFRVAEKILKKELKAISLGLEIIRSI